MTSSEPIKQAAGQTQPDHSVARISELLSKLAAADNLANAAAFAGVTDDQARLALKRAAEIIRSMPKHQPPKKWPSTGSIMDWREMTVAEALEILAEHAISQDATPEPKA